jgi:thiamine biosynthesis lipoprotein
MGTVFSLQLIRGPEDERARFDAVVAACWQELSEIERHFSLFLPDSDIRRMARGELTLAKADRRVREVEALCRDARQRSNGLFDAWRDGTFDPTGLVRGWAVDRLTDRYLLPLLHELGASAVGLNAGGDARLHTAPTSAWRWRLGLADPRQESRAVRSRRGGLAETASAPSCAEPRPPVIATVEIMDGAVATAGPAGRGIVLDPRTGGPALSVASATVLADTLTEADLWATTAVAAGFGTLDWIAQSGTRSGLLVAPDGRTRRWTGPVELLAPSGPRSAA